MKFHYRINLLLLIFFILNSREAGAQRVFVNTPDAIYELTGGMGNCGYVSLPIQCAEISAQRIYSIAYHKNILYILTQAGNNVYAVNLAAGNTCTYLTSFPTTGPFAGASTLNSFGIDKNGVIYGIDYYTLGLVTFNTVTRQHRNLGRVPAQAAGDLLFYEDKLVYAALDKNIYEVNLADPSASQVYMSTGTYDFFGIISFPFNCNKNKVFGLSASFPYTLMVELDMDNRVIRNVACNLIDGVYDAASEVEDGNTIGVTVDSLNIKAPCLPSENKGSVRIKARTAGAGAITYTLNSGETNTTGNFTDLPVGNYSLRITNADGCFADTSFVIAHGVTGPVNITALQPQRCGLATGQLSVTAASPYILSYSLNQQPFQPLGLFTDLDAGPYSIRVKDNGGCQVDTSAILRYIEIPSFVRNITVKNTICENRSGSVTLDLEGDAQASFNNSIRSDLNSYTGLDSGVYPLTIFHDGNCRYDTTITILREEDPAPDVDIIKKDQFCLINNGSIKVNTTGTTGPYVYSLDNGAFTAQPSFTNLAPGMHTVVVRNRNTCTWRMNSEILPYQLVPVDLQTTVSHPTCEQPYEGRIEITVTGSEAPYSYLLDGVPYTNRIIEHLPHGKHLLQIVNRDGCVIKQTDVELVIDLNPACDRVYVPSAFSPNGDGLNDVLKPVFGPFVTDVVFMIYNRNGEVVLRNKGERGWDGKYRGQQQATGVFIWTFSYRNYRNEPRFLKGTITLIR